MDKPRTTNLSDQIAACVDCKKYSRRIDPINHRDLFQDAWLKIREKEINSPNWKPTGDYKAYFYRTLLNSYIDKGKRSDTKKIKTVLLSWAESEQREGRVQFLLPDTDNLPCEAYLVGWLNERTQDETQTFYKNILTLAIYSKNTSDAIRMCKISRAKFYEYRQQAINQLINDYTLDASVDHESGNTIL